MVTAQKMNGSNPPMNRPTNTNGFSRLRAPGSNSTLCVKSANRASAPRPAEPMAYPFVTALVVLPTLSRASVIFLVDSGNLAISAIPPALSVIGPYESRATIIPVVESIAAAAMAILYIPSISLPEKPPPT